MIRNLVIATLLVSSCSLQGQTDSALARFTGGEVLPSELSQWLAAFGQEGMEATRQRNVKSIAMSKYLAAQFDAAEADPEYFLETKLLRNSLIGKEYFSKRNERISIPDDVVEEHLEVERDRFSLPERVRLRNLFLSTEGKTDQETASIRASMDSILEKIRKGADFAALARTHSDSINRSDGGLVGNVPRGKLPPDIEEVAFGLKPGTSSPILNAEHGFVILYCERFFPASEKPDEEIRRLLRNRLRKEKSEGDRNRVVSSWIEEMEIYLDALRIGESNETGVSSGPEASFSVAEVRLLLNRRIPDLELESVALDQVKRVMSAPIVNARATFVLSSEGNLSDELREKVDWQLQDLKAKEAFRIRLAESIPATPPSEGELRDLYYQLKDSLSTEPEMSAEWISIQPPAGSLSDDQKELNRIRERMLANEDLSFESAAESISGEVKSRTSTAPAEWAEATRIRSLGAIPYRVISELSVGEVSRIFRTTSGPPRLWLAKLHGKRPSRPMSYEEALPGLDKYLLEQKEDQRRKDLEAQILEEMSFQLVP